MSDILFTPCELGPITLRNRSIRSAAFENMCIENKPSQALFDYHWQVAKGGIGMTTLAYAAVNRSGLSFKGQLWMREEIVPELKKITDTIHQEGAKVSIQLGHCGNMTHYYTCGQIPAKERITHFKEVCLGYTVEEAMMEAQRCLQCKNPFCVQDCPVYIDIPGFIKQVAEGNFEKAAQIINKDSALPAVCGRVCPQETQCEGACIMGKKFDAIAIGKLERFVADWSRENKIEFDKPVMKNGHKIAVIGSGPAGITCARELLLKGYEVTVFEALHQYGGVLVYGIPSFRLPKETVVDYEIENVRKLGATFEKNVVVGKTVTIETLMKEEGFEAVFIASGAGLPNFMNIPGENLNGVVSANEFLTRNNLLFAYKKEYRTPNYVGKKVAVVGGGNVAMDAARTALRLGGGEVYIVYRRSEEELPARIEEIHHAKEEGIVFNVLCNPVEILGDEKGWVKAMRCVRMQLGEPDASGRRRPIVIPGSEFVMDTDMVIMSIGTSPNPIIAKTTPGLEINKWDCIVADEETGQTTREGIFAGGDAVSGAATVILAMGAGKKAAKAIDEYVQKKTK
jgi:glutamate synthase (NADPH/NADH) small chain